MNPRRSLIPIAALLALLAAACGGGSGRTETTTPPTTTTGAPADSTIAQDIEPGKALYERTCTACHGIDGGGLPGLGKPLAGSDFIQDQSTDDLVAFIAAGREATDPENTSGIAMPARGGNPDLTDNDLAAIVEYLRTLPAPAATPGADVTEPESFPYVWAPFTTPWQLRNPVSLVPAAEGGRLFVLELAGTIRLVNEDGSVEEQPFLDMTGMIGLEGEGGMVGLAFHPEYESNRRFFLHYTNLEGDVRIVEMLAGEDFSRAEPGSERLLLEIPQPAPEHQGGGMAFGPDGLLYVGMGDGGGFGDPFGNGQDPTTLLGVILRLDVDGGDPYAVPPENAFGPGAEATEVFAYGLRNPYRIFIDDEEGLIYVGDVGQDRAEEVDVIPIDQPGLNFGWPITEGFSCFPGVGIEDDVVADCDRTGLVDPVVEYLHDDAKLPHCAVVGGVMYRGAAFPELTDHYFYGDLCTKTIWSFRYQNGGAADQLEWDLLARPVEDPILGFGSDARGELYLLTGNAGTIYRLEASPGE